MKNIFFTLSFVALSLGSASAQNISAADQKGIEEVFAFMSSAFDKGDASGLASILSENAEQIIPTGEIIRGRANIVAGLTGYIAYLKSQPKADRFENKKINQQYRYLTPDYVVTTYIDENTSYFGDKIKVEKTTTSLLMHKVGGKWLTELVCLTIAPGN